MSNELSAEEFNRLTQKDGRPRNKYRNLRTELDGIVFDSRAEARRYSELLLMQEAGAIEGLVLQPSFPLTVNGMVIGAYRADFMYFDNERQQRIVEDVKGVRTPIYRIKKKLMLALHEIEIQEIP